MPVQKDWKSIIENELEQLAKDYGPRNASENNRASTTEFSKCAACGVEQALKS